MRKLLAAMFVALLMVGCGEDKKSGSDSSEERDLGMEQLYKEAFALHEKGKYREAKVKMQRAYVAFRRLPVKENATRIRYLRTLCNISAGLQENDKAIEYAKEIAIHAMTDDDLSYAYGNLGFCYLTKGQYNEAISYYEKSLAIKLRTLDSKHPEVGKSYNNIGLCYFESQQYLKAIEYYQRSLAILEALDHSDLMVSKSYNNIGSCFLYSGFYDKATEFYEKGLAIKLETLDHKHPSVALSHSNLFVSYVKKGESDKAIWHHEKALAIQLETLGHKHPEVARSYNNIGAFYIERLDKTKAMANLLKAKAIRMQKLGPQHPDTKYTQELIDSLK
jgi:tetratricopeptide (TPR) repeat protein